MQAYSPMILLLLIWMVNGLPKIEVESMVNWPDIEVESPFPVTSIAHENPCALPDSTIGSLQNAGFIFITCPFGVVLGSTKSYQKEYLQYAANVVANILDQDNDGNVDDPNVLAKLKHTKSNGGSFLACGVSEEEENQEDS